VVITLTVKWARYTPGEVLLNCNDLLATKLIAARMALPGARPKAYDEKQPEPPAAGAPAPTAPPPAEPSAMKLPTPKGKKG